MSVLLYLEAESLRAWFWRRGRLSAGPRFPANETGQHDFSAWLEGHRDERFTLLADVVDEAFQLETLPRASRADRRAMIARKLEQFAEGTPFCCAIGLGRERQGERGERILLAALSRSAQLEDWLRTLRAAEACLVALLTSAQLVAALRPRALRDAPRLLLVCLTPAGIRQTFFEQGRLRFSRLATLANGEDWIPRLPYEVRKTQQYLAAQHALTRREVLPVALLATHSDLQALNLVCADDETLHYIGVDLAEGFRAAGLPAATEANALPLLLREAARSSRGPQFAPETDRAGFREHQLRRAALAIGFAVFAGGLAFTANNLNDTERLADAAEAQEPGTRALEQRLAGELASLDRSPFPPAALQAALSSLARNEARTGELAASLLRASHALDRHRDISLEKLSWTLLPGRGSELLLSADLDAAASRDAGKLTAVEDLIASLRESGASEVDVLKPASSVDSTADRFSLRARYPGEAR
ncbi:hypothetical protein [Niveibacterium terrae]|uniref:hypothetical protein n=1 Tax=Niveibacterium terrae TaxID=3373598 RepID=UPI003A8F7281